MKTTIAVVGLAVVTQATAAGPVSAGSRGTTTRESVSATGVQANGHSGGSALSADGRYVAFASVASNLVPGDTNGHLDAFVRDRLTGVTQRVSVGPAANMVWVASPSPSSCR